MVLQNVEYLIVSPGSKDYRDYLAFRHAVFCEELKRIPSSGDSRAETDEFDVHSLHIFCRTRDTREALACSRLILPGPNGLNVSARYSLQFCGEMPVDRVGEIGRLTLAPGLRRWRSEELLARRRSVMVAGEGNSQVDLGDFRRHGAFIALGLYRQIFRLMGRYGISHCFAAMEPSLARLYARLGFAFKPAGPVSHDVIPAKRPYMIDLQHARAVLAGRNADLYGFIVGGDELADASRGDVRSGTMLGAVSLSLSAEERLLF